MYFSAENLLGVNPVAMNYKMRHNKNWPAKYSLAWPYRSYVICGGIKTENTVWTREVTCKGSYTERKACSVCELATESND